MAYPPSQAQRQQIDTEYQKIDQRLDEIQQDIRGHREAATAESIADHRRLKEIETLFESRQNWMKWVSCLLTPCTFPIKKLCCEPCCTPCSNPTETKVDLCWHACNPDLYFDLDLEHSRKAEGLPTAKEVCLNSSEREELQCLYDRCRDIRLNREWAQIKKDQETLKKHKSGKF